MPSGAAMSRARWGDLGKSFINLFFPNLLEIIPLTGIEKSKSESSFLEYVLSALLIILYSLNVLSLFSGLRITLD